MPASAWQAGFDAHLTNPFTLEALGTVHGGELTGCLTSALEAEPVIARSRAAVDEFHTAKAQRRPVGIDGDLTNGIESSRANRIPAGIAVEIADQ